MDPRYGYEGRGFRNADLRSGCVALTRPVLCRLVRRQQVTPTRVMQGLRLFLCRGI
jgi:hypothetical protein